MIHSAAVIAQMLSHATILKLAFAKQFSLNPVELLALLMVGGAEGLSIKALRKSLAVPASSLTFTIDSLEKKKLVRRQRSTEDRRQWLVSLSPKGERLYADVLQAEGAAMSPALERLSEPDRTAFMRIIETIFGDAACRVPRRRGPTSVSRLLAGGCDGPRVAGGFADTGDRADRLWRGQAAAGGQRPWQRYPRVPQSPARRR